MPSDRHRELWGVNNKVYKRGLEIVKPGVRCSDVARDLNEICLEYDRLQYQVIGYGHSSVEQVDKVLEPSMVITVEPMIGVPEGHPGAGRYREHDIRWLLQRLTMRI